MRVTYIGSSRGTSIQRAKSLVRLGHQLEIIDPWDWVDRVWLARYWMYHFGGIGVSYMLGKRLLLAIERSKPDLIFVNQGEFFCPHFLKMIRQENVPIVNYANDNPFSFENRRRFFCYRRAIPYYDLIVVVFADAVEKAVLAGAGQVKRVFISADEVAHAPFELSEKQYEDYSSDVAFIGTWMPERGRFMLDLIHHGIPLSIWGDRWDKAPEWPEIKSHWRGPGVFDETGYAAIIQSAKICLGLVNGHSGNLHTDRSMQVPSLGGLLCAERTTEHLMLYAEGAEAVFWSDSNECATVCRKLLADDVTRKKIAADGRKRALSNGNFNEPVMRTIIQQGVLAARRNPSLSS